MKKLSKLGKECISNKGLCCENRTPPFFLPSEIDLLLKDKIIRENFMFGRVSARPKSLCNFFKEPFCNVYEQRPVDCRTYPVSIDLQEEKVVYVIDMNCPGAQKGVISDNFIKKAIKTWKENMPSADWLKEYLSNDNTQNYRWVSVREYRKYRRSLIKE